MFIKVNSHSVYFIHNSNIPMGIESVKVFIFGHNFRTLFVIHVKVAFDFRNNISVSLGLDFRMFKQIKNLLNKYNVNGRQ